MKIYKYVNGTLVIAEVRKTKKMYVVDRIISQGAYITFYVTQRLYEQDISFSPEEAFSAARNKFKERIGMYKDAMEKAISDLELLETIAVVYDDCQE